MSAFPIAAGFTLLAISFHYAAAQSTSSFGAPAALDDFVKEALLQTGTTGRTRVAITNRELSYDFKPDLEAFRSAKPNRIDSALEAAVRAAAIERDLKSVLPLETFWTVPLLDLRNASSTFLHLAEGKKSDAEWTPVEAQFQTRTASDFRALEDGLIAYGDRAGLNVISKRGDFEGFLVEIKIDPPKVAPVRYVPYLVYLRSRLQKTDLTDDWLDLNEGKRILAGRYHYRAEWPKSMNGPVEGNFEVHENRTITFYPKAN